MTKYRHSYKSGKQNMYVYIKKVIFFKNFFKDKYEID